MLRGKQQRRGPKVRRQLIERLEPRLLLATVGVDSSFGTNGLVIFGAANQIDQGLSITLQNDSKIVVGGFNQNGDRRARLTRLNSNGAFDATFGTGGHSELTGMQNPWSLAIGPGGNIVAAGDGWNGKINGKIASTTGAGLHQWTQTFNLGQADTFYDVKIESGGRIIAVGSGNGINGTAFMFAAMQPNGSLDSTYKRGGAFLDDLVPAGPNGGGLENGFVIVPRADGGYLAVGAGISGGSFRLVTVRHHADGQRDESYGNHGVTGPLGPGSVGQVGDVRMLSDGSFFVATYAILAKFTPQGSLDPTFPVREIPSAQRQEIRPLPGGKVAVVTFNDPVTVTLFDEFGNLLGETQSAPLAPGHFAEVDDGIVQADGKVLVTGRWSPQQPFFPGDQWQLTTDEFVARTLAFPQLVPEPSAVVWIGAMVVIKLLARRPRSLHHRRGGMKPEARNSDGG